MILLCLAMLTGCGHGPYPDELVVDPAFSADESAQVIAAIDEWGKLCPDIALPVRIGENPNVRRDCEGWPGQIFFSSQTIDICPEAKTDPRRIMLHELVHLYRQDELHVDDQDSILQIVGFLPHHPSAADVALVCP